jgi:hypothetical protein
VTPLPVLRASLAESRARGLGFEMAWRGATRKALAAIGDPDGWTVVLGEMQSAWQRA